MNKIGQVPNGGLYNLITVPVINSPVQPPTTSHAPYALNARFFPSKINLISSELYEWCVHHSISVAHDMVSSAGTQ